MARRLRILVDDSAAFNQGAGIGRYARNIVPAAIRYLSEPDVTLWYAPDRPGKAQFEDATLSKFADLPEPKTRRGPLSRKRMDQLWFRARIPLPMQLLAGKADVVYSPDFTVPPAPRTPRIVTVHDLAFLVTPDKTSEPLRRFLSAVIPRHISKAEHIIAVSESTRFDLINVLGVDSERVTVVANGVDDRFLGAPALSQAQRQSLGIPERYLLTVGTLEPRKNHLNLFRAIDSLSSKIDLPLVVAGRRGWDYEPILAAARPLVSARRVILLDYVPEEALPGLYAGAATLIYPSWYEGFGLPVLEALAVGIPVIASNVPALREVAGGEAILVEPDSPEDIAAAVIESLTLNKSADSKKRRQAQAARYRWDDSGKQLAEVILRLTANRG